MAKLIFNKDHINMAGIVGAAFNDAEINTLIGNVNVLNNYASFDITNDQLEGLIKGTKTLDIVNNVPVINDTRIDVGDRTIDRNEFESQLGVWKINLAKILSKKENHTQANYIQSALDFVKSIDLDSLTYPTANLENHLLDNNKYVNSKFI